MKTENIERMLVACRSTRFPSQPCVEQATAELAALRSENERLNVCVSKWLAANSPGGWIDDLRKSDATARSQLAQARKALEKLARLGNGDQYGNSQGNVIAQDCLHKLTSPSPVATPAASEPAWCSPRELPPTDDIDALNRRGDCAGEQVPQIICTCGKPIASCKCKEPVPQDEKESK